MNIRTNYDGIAKAISSFRKMVTRATTKPPQSQKSNFPAAWPQSLKPPHRSFLLCCHSHNLKNQTFPQLGLSHSSRRIAASFSAATVTHAITSAACISLQGLSQARLRSHSPTLLRQRHQRHRYPQLYVPLNCNYIVGGRHETREYTHQ